jgi:hypothetical protein
MTFREVLRVLRHVRDVLAEYVATEERKRADAKQRAAEARRFAAEAAARQAEEAAAQEAAMRTAKQRLIARATATPKGRRKRGEAPRKSSSAPIRTMALPPVTADVFNSIAEQQEPPPSAPPGLPPGLPPQLVEMFTQLGQLDDAIRSMFTVTEGLNAWFERIQRHRHWGPVVVGLSMGLSVLAQRVSSRMYHRNLFLAHQREIDDHAKRVDRMRRGDWKEKMRYMLWTNGQRQEREARAAQRDAPAAVTLASAGGW